MRGVTSGEVVQVIKLEESGRDTVEARRLDWALEDKVSGPSMMPMPVWWVERG